MLFLKHFIWEFFCHCSTTFHFPSSLNLKYKNTKIHIFLWVFILYYFLYSVLNLKVETKHKFDRKLNNRLMWIHQIQSRSFSVDDNRHNSGFSLFFRHNKFSSSWNPITNKSPFILIKIELLLLLLVHCLNFWNILKWTIEEK